MEGEVESRPKKTRERSNRKSAGRTRRKEAMPFALLLLFVGDASLYCEK